MAPQLARRLAILVCTLAFLGSPCPAFAQDLQDPLAMRMPDDATNVDVKAIVAMATRLGVPVGFEEPQALTERVSNVFRVRTRDAPIVSVRPRPLDVRGVRLGQALDAAVAADRQYAWRAMGGVVVIRPVAAWSDAFHPFAKPAAPLRLENVHRSQLVDAVRRVVDPRASALAPPRDDEPTVSLDFAGGTLLDLLNAAARAGGFGWRLSSSSSTILLDGGRAVEVLEPVLSLGAGADDAAIPLRR
jgi:hypothetical protein